MNLVPAHVRDRQAVRKAAHAPAEHPQAAVLAHLLACLKEELHAHANAQKGDSVTDRGHEVGLQAQSAQVADGVPKGANAGEHQRRGPAHLLRRRDDPGAHSEAAESHLDVAQVAHAIVHDAQHLRASLWSKQPPVGADLALSPGQVPARAP